MWWDHNEQFNDAVRFREVNDGSCNCFGNLPCKATKGICPFDPDLLKFFAHKVTLGIVTNSGTVPWAPIERPRAVQSVVFPHDKESECCRMRDDDDIDDDDDCEAASEVCNQAKVDGVKFKVNDQHGEFLPDGSQKVKERNCPCSWKEEASWFCDHMGLAAATIGHVHAFLRHELPQKLHWPWQEGDLHLKMPMAGNGNHWDATFTAQPREDHVRSTSLRQADVTLRKEEEDSPACEQ